MSVRHIPFTSALICSLLVVAACSKAGPPTAEQPAATSTPPASAAAGSSTPSMMSSHGAGETMSIADVWKSRQDLAGKTVTVTGTVVKYNGGIMDRNWVHIQDGTGDAEKKTNDLTVTTADEVAVGDKVTATGVVGIDKDFTAGYVYPVMLEQAHVVKK